MLLQSILYDRLHLCHSKFPAKEISSNPIHNKHNMITNFIVWHEGWRPKQWSQKSNGMVNTSNAHTTIEELLGHCQAMQCFLSSLCQDYITGTETSVNQSWLRGHELAVRW
jgi:hypothetical protein